VLHSYLRYTSALKFIIVVPFLFTLLSNASVAQSELPFNGKSEIEKVTVQVEGDFSEKEIANELATKVTPGSVWIFLNENISKGLGAPRSYFEPLIFYNDIVHLHEYLRERGYFNAKIDTSVTFEENLQHVDVLIKITTNRRSFIDTVVYAGLSDLAPELSNEIFQNSELKVGNPFLKHLISNEQSRALKILHSNGYPLARVDSISIKRYASTNNISIRVQYDAGKRFKFGAVLYAEEREKIDEEVLSRQLDFKPGEIYSEEKRTTSEQNLNRLGIFDNANVKPLFQNLSAESDTVPMSVSYRVLGLQEITPEFLVVNENNQLFSTGLGLGYKHRNLFGGAQNFSVTARARINRLQDLDFGGALKRGLREPTLYSTANVQSLFAFPYFFSNRTNANITLSYENERQPDYALNTLRAKLGLVTRFAAYTGGLTDINIERVDPKIKIAQGLRVEDTTKQFNVIAAFTLQRNKTNNPFSPTEGFFHSGTIESAGLVSRIFGSLGLPFSEYYKASFIAKYFFSSEYNKSQVFAVKLQGGFAQLYNSKNTTPVPLPRRFFVGGSGSVRGWRDRQLAAFGDTIKGGNVAFEGSIESRTQLFPGGGQFLFLNTENIWSVLFFDYGNTWNKIDDATLKQVALAAGFGIRYETFVGPFRFDIAWRLYDPKAPVGQQWLYEQSFFKNSYSIVHFGIGHAF